MLEAATSDKQDPDARTALPQGRRAARPLLVTRSTRGAPSRRSSSSTRRTSPRSRRRSSRSSSATASASAWATRATTTTCCCMWKRLLDEVPEAAAQMHASYDHILVDEYQDTNRLQGDIVDGMARVKKNVTVVGDDAQAIYSFRGASFENILGFPKRYPEAKTFRLTRNYRSTPEILALANASIAHNERQFPKELTAARESGGLPAVVALPDIADQARFAAQRLLEWHDEGEKLQDLAVLYRAHYQALELQIELTRRGIPYEIRSGTRFFEQRHVKDVLAFLRIVVNPKDELSWKRALKIFPRVGERSASAVWEAIGSRPDPLAAFRALDGRSSLGRGGDAALKPFRALLSRLDGPSAALVAVRGDPLRRRGRLQGLRPREVPQRRRAPRRPRAVRPVRPDLRLAAGLPRGDHALQRALGRGRRGGRAGRRPRRALLDPPGQGPRVEPRHRDGALGGPLSRTTARSRPRRASRRSAGSSTWPSRGRRTRSRSSTRCSPATGTAWTSSSSRRAS